MKQLLFFVVFLSATSFAAEMSDIFYQNLWSKLPAKLSKTQIIQLDRGKVLQILGPAQKERGSIHFYQLSWKKFDTTISYKDNSLEYILYHLPKNTLFMKDIRQWVLESDYEKATPASKTSSNHERQRYVLSYPKKGVKLIFTKGKSGVVESVLFHKVKK